MFGSPPSPLVEQGSPSRWLADWRGPRWEPSQGRWVPSQPSSERAPHSVASRGEGPLREPSQGSSVPSAVQLVDVVACYTLMN